MGLDVADKKLLSKIQEGFPLVPQPFQALAQELGISESDALARVKDLKKQGLIREIRGVFDNKALGYKSTLVAMRIPEAQLDQAAAIVGQHPGVSHNYSRNHSYNLWYTLTLPPDQDVPAVAADLAHRAGAQSTLVLPMVRMFKLKLDFGLPGSERPAEPQSGSARRSSRNGHLSEQDVAAIRGLQRDLPLEARPFLAISQQLSLSEQELLDRGRDLLERGVMRRYSALLRHQQMGFKANAMGCWLVPEDRIEDVGPVMASFPQVSHCYQRITYPEWRHNLYTMIHGGSHEECEATARAISVRTGIEDYILLYSIKEYKKKLVDYFN